MKGEMHRCIPSVFTVAILHGQLFSKSGQKVYKRFIIIPQTAPPVDGFTPNDISVSAIPDNCALNKGAVIHGNFLTYTGIKTYIALLFNDIKFF